MRSFIKNIINKSPTSIAGKMQSVKLFLCGDVMLARGVDMIQKVHCDPVLYEGNGLDAHDYVHLAVQNSGRIPALSERSIDYTWGDAMKILKDKKPDVKIINLETSITTNSTPWPGKGIHYRMHPENIAMLKEAEIDCCVLANNHTADWGFPGLCETLKVLKKFAIDYAGAGFDLSEAQKPAVLSIPSLSKNRVLIFAAGHYSSGVPDQWRAKPSSEGVHIIDVHHVKNAISSLKELVNKYKNFGDIAVLSIHWGGNWGFDVEKYHSEFAHAAIDEAAIDLIHGHSSHHVKGIEVYKNKLIMYGCGDFINDYEGISGHEEYRGDLSLMYFVDINCNSGNVHSVEMVPTKMEKLKVNRAGSDDTKWLYNTMSRECGKLGSNVELTKQGELRLKLENYDCTQL